MTSNLLLNNTLSTITSEWKINREFHESFKLVDKLLSFYGEENLAERLYTDIPLEYSWETVGNLFAILIWSMSDENATTLIETTKKWLLDGNDLRKIQIALHLDIYPFRKKDKMIEVLSRLSEIYPEIRSTCEELIASRKKDEK
jgi:hypothetical protein